MDQATDASPPEDLGVRTFRFAMRCIKVVDSLAPSRAADVIGKQLLRSATSVGANYRAARRARSTAEFIAKLGIVEEEADESCYWLEMIVEADLAPADRMSNLCREAHEIVAIIVASIRTAKRNRSQKQ